MARSSTSHAHDQPDVDAPLDESTPLLRLPSDEESCRSMTLDPNCGSDRRDSDEPTQTPLPKAQLGALIAVRVVDPIAYQQIFPYINQLIADLRIAEPERVGFYSGLVESVYSLAQVFSVYQWGRISDSVGRRPVVFIGLIGIAATTMSFGLSTSFVGIVLSRFFGGLVAGNVAVIHSILTEITDDTNQHLAVPIYSLSWPMGSIIGPLIGGTLANAASQYPEYFSWPIFVEHPYLPPCIVSAACAIFGAVLGYIFIEETLPSKRKNVGGARSSRSTESSHADSGFDETEPLSMIELLAIPTIRVLTISGFALSFLSLAFDVVFALFCYTPVGAGGLGLDPSAIGNMLAIAGTLTVLLRFFAMPHVLRHFDYAKTYNACMYTWPVAFGFLPLLNVLARTSSPTSSYAVSLFIWTGLLALLALSKIGATPNSLSILLIKRHAPSASALGRCNGLVQFAMCVGRTVGPVVVSWLFTGLNGAGWARRWGVGWVWAVVMVCGAIAGARVTSGIEAGEI